MSCLWICLAQLCLCVKKSIMYILMATRLPSLPLSILYSHFSEFCLFFVFSFAISTNLMLWKLKFSLSFCIKFQFCHLSFPVSWCVLQIALHFTCCHLLTPSALAPAHSLEMISSATPSTVLAITRHLHGLCELPQYLQLLYVTFLLVFVLSMAVFGCLCFFMASNPLLSFVTPSFACWALYTSALLAQHNTCSLVISLVFLVNG